MGGWREIESTSTLSPPNTNAKLIVPALTKALEKLMEVRDKGDDSNFKVDSVHDNKVVWVVL
eukprot:11288474-Ditylum_brightwellii.AAC.1